jgi:hypothetical protein
VTASNLDLAVLERRLWTRVLAGATLYLVIAIGALVLVTESPASASQLQFATAVGAAVLGAVAVMIPAGVAASRHVFRRATTFVAEGAEPTWRERSNVRRLPADHALIVLACSAVLTPVALGTAARYHPRADIVRALPAAAVMTGGACLLAYVVAERALGPLLARVADVTGRTGLSTVARFCLASAQGVAVPVAAILMAPDRLGIEAVHWFVLVGGLAVSLTGTVVTSRSIASRERS